MGARQKEWARATRTRLVTTLGGMCVVCGSQTELTLDCIKPTGADHHRMSADGRMTFYRRQARAGNVQLLCHWCNSAKSGANPAQWNAAFQYVRKTEAILRLSQTPGGEQSLTAAEKRECFREALRRFYEASRAPTADV